MLSVRLLQTPSVYRDGQPVAFPYQRVDALLYYMLVCRTATRRELISLLWESCSEEIGLKNLRNTLYSLKKCLGGDLLISPQKSILMLNPEWEIDCDYERFTQQNDFSAYGGSFLQGFSVKNAFTYEEWLTRTRERLHAQYLCQLMQMAFAAGEHSNLSQAQQFATQYLMEDPFNEEMVVFLMQQYRSALQYPKVAQVYAQLKQGLEAELGVTPLEQTTILFYEIMNEWNDTASAGKSSAASALPVGRERLYSQLRAAINSFCNGRGKAPSQVLLGESGSGKNALIAQLAHEPDMQALLVMHSSCTMSEMGQPLMPWDTIMLAVSQALRELRLSIPEHTLKRLASVFPLLDNEYPLKGTPSATRSCTAELSGAMLQLFSLLAHPQKILLIIENLQWIDIDSLALLDALIRRLEPGGLMVVLTARDFCRVEVQAFLDNGNHDGLFSLHRLQPLTLENTRELLRRELGEQVADQLAERFYSETGGNLKLLFELTQAYRRNENTAGIISSAASILLRRMDGLDRSADTLAELIALFPESAPCEILPALSGMEGVEIEVAAAQLITRGLVYRTDSNQSPTLRYTQQRMRVLVYERMPETERQRLHHKIAQLLNANSDLTTPSDCRQIAYHYSAAKEPVWTLHFTVLALNLEAALLCEPFPVLSGTPEKLPSREELQREISYAQRSLNALKKDAVSNLALEDIDRLLVLIRGRLALFEGQTQEGFALLGTLSEAYLPKNNAVFLQICRLLAASAQAQQSVDVMERYISVGMRLLERHPNPAELAMFAHLKGNLFCLKCAYDISLYYLQDAIDTLESLPDRHRYRLKLAAAYCDLGRVKRQQHDYVAATGHYKKSLALFGSDNVFPGAAWVYMNYGRIAFALEDHTRAYQLFKQGYDSGKNTGEASGTATCAAFCAYYTALENDYTAAADALFDAHALSTRGNSPLEQAFLFFVKARLRQKLDREQRRGNPLDLLLTETTDNYARSGIRLLADIPDVHELKLLNESLHYSIANQSSYRAPELYSKNRRFMTE